MFNVIRIPTKFTKGIRRLTRNDKAELLDMLMSIWGWESINIPDSIVWDTVELIYWEWMNMESRNGNKPKESLINAYSEWHGIVTPSNPEHRVKYSRVEESIVEDKESKDSIDLKKSDTWIIKKEKNPDIDNLIQELKTQADLLWIAYDKKQDRNFGKHITNAKEFGDFCEKIGQERIEFAKNIMIASEKIKFWKWTCAWPMLIYQNYAEVYNLTKTKSESSKIVKIDILDW